MTDERPTKALVAELRAALARREEQLSTAMMDLRTSEDRRAELGDPEAVCLARCVSAIGLMRAALNNQRTSMSYATVWDDTRPRALGDPIGRVLLHLAARYDQAIGAIPPAQPERPEGQQLVSVPAHVAEQLQRMPMEAWDR